MPTSRTPFEIQAHCNGGSYVRKSHHPMQQLLPRSRPRVILEGSAFSCSGFLCRFGTAPNAQFQRAPFSTDSVTQHRIRRQAKKPGKMCANFLAASLKSEQVIKWRELLSKPFALSGYEPTTLPLRSARAGSSDDPGSYRAHRHDRAFSHPASLH